VVTEVDAAGRHDRLGVIVRTQQAMPTAGALRRPSTQHEVQSFELCTIAAGTECLHDSQDPLVREVAAGPHALCPDDPHLRSGDLAGLREGRHAGARAWPLARNDERKLIHENVTKCLLGSLDLGFSARRAGEGSVQIHAAN